METDNNAAGLVPPDLLAAAAADAAASNPETPAAPDAPPAAAADPAAESKTLIEFAYGLFSPVYPSLAKVYTPETRANLAAAAAPVLAKYGFSMGKLGPEVMLALAIVPLIAPTIQAIRADRAAAAPEKPAAAVVPVPPADATPPAVNPLQSFPGINAES